MFFNFQIAFLILTLELVFGSNIYLIKTPLRLRYGEIFAIEIFGDDTVSSDKLVLFTAVHQSGVTHMDKVLLPRTEKFESTKTAFYTTKYVERSLNSINIGILFDRSMHNKMFSFLVTDISKEMYQDIMKTGKTWSETPFVTHMTVKLYDNWHLKMDFKFNDSVYDFMMVDTIAAIECTAYDGFPEEDVKVRGLEHLKVIKKTFNKNTNSITALINPRVSDNGKEVICQVADKMITRKLEIIKPMEMITVFPEIYGKFVENSNVHCVAGNGFPDPIVQWSLTKGPENAERYFRIENDTILHMMPDSASNALWTFTCGQRVDTATKFVHKPLSITVDFVVVPEKRTEKTNFKLEYIVAFVISISIILSLILAKYIGYKRSSRKSHSEFIGQLQKSFRY